MVAMLEAPYECPAAWLGPDKARSVEGIHTLTAGEIDELDAALGRVKSRGARIPDITRDDFLLPNLSATLAGILSEIESGKGFALIRGLPIERYSEQDLGVIYWGVGSHFGRAIAQNAMGDLLGHVRDLGRDWDADYSARGYQTTSGLPFHNDSGDMVGLLCLRPAKSGGLSTIVSSVSVHNEILRRRPDLARVLYEPFYLDARGEEADGEEPYYVVPRFNYHGGRLYTQYSRAYIESAQRFPQVPRLTCEQIEALDLFDTLANSADLRLDMNFLPGDMQFLNNHVILHARTDYQDYEEPHRKRHLLRLWLITPGYDSRPPAFDRRYADIMSWQACPRR